MVAVIDSFVANLAPYFGVALDVIVLFAQLIGILLVLGYVVMLYMYDTKINIRDYAKGGRIITIGTRAMRIKDKKTGAPKLRLFGKMGFFGEVISEPPAECLVPYRSRITHKMYDFIRKDGLYFPIRNFVLGSLQEMEKDVEKEVYDKKTKKKKTVIVKEIVEVYSIQGSGLEIDRNFDSEQAVQNKLIQEAVQFRNKKPTEVIASFVLMIVTIIVSGVVMWFAWTQFGNMAGAIASLREPLREGITAAAQNIIGPG